MRIRDTPEFIGPLFPADSFVLMTIHISPTERRVHRVSPEVFAAASGPVGPAGPAGPGVPVGGTVGQVLAKIDGVDYNTEWTTPTGGGGAPDAHAPTHQFGGSDPIKLDDLAIPDDNLDLDANTFTHGLLRKLSGDPIHVLNGQGDFVPQSYIDLIDVPTSFNPSAHAATHQHGGADEVATVTAAANAIPKADGSAKLDTWISNASTTVLGKVQLATDGESTAGEATQSNDSRLSNSRSPNGAASGDLSGTYPSPTVTQARGIRETAGPTTLVVGAIADGQFLKRTGATVVGSAGTLLPAGGSAFNILAKDAGNVPGWTADPQVDSLTIGPYVIDYDGAFIRFEKAADPGITLFAAGDWKATFYFDTGANVVLFQNRVGTEFSIVDGSNNPIDLVARDVHLTGVVQIDGLAVVIEQQPLIIPITDNTTGTVSDTLAAITDPANTPLTADALRDDLVANTLPPIRNALASLSAKSMEIVGRLMSHGLIEPNIPPAAPDDFTETVNDGTGVGFQMPASLPALASELVLFRGGIEVAAGLQANDIYLDIGAAPVTFYGWTIRARNAAGDSGDNPTPIADTTVDVPTANMPNLSDDGGGNYSVAYNGLGTNATANVHLFVQVNGGGYTDVGEGAFVALVGDTIDAYAVDLNVYGEGPDSAINTVVLA